MAVFVSVENQSEFDAMIYAYWSGNWTRMGLVEADGTRLLPFEWGRKEVRFVIELLGDEGITDFAPEIEYPTSNQPTSGRVTLIAALNSAVNPTLPPPPPAA